MGPQAYTQTCAHSTRSFLFGLGFGMCRARMIPRTSEPNFSSPCGTVAASGFRIQQAFGFEELGSNDTGIKIFDSLTFIIIRVATLWFRL